MSRLGDLVRSTIHRPIPKNRINKAAFVPTESVPQNRMYRQKDTYLR